MEAGVRLSDLLLYYGHFLQCVILPTPVTSFPKAVDLNKNVFWVISLFKSVFKTNYSVCALVILLQYWPQVWRWLEGGKKKHDQRREDITAAMLTEIHRLSMWVIFISLSVASCPNCHQDMLDLHKLLIAPMGRWDVKCRKDGRIINLM